MEKEEKTFVAWDYVVFALVLVISASIGIFYGLTGGKQKTTAEFLMANRQMHFLPVALSLLASFMSAITLLGTPAEIYRFGTIYWWIWLSYAWLLPVSAHVFLPVFYRLRVITVYEYLEYRFKSKALRMSAAIIFSIQMIMYMAIVLYAPSLALNQVTGLNVWISVFSVGIICTFYTAIGGMKAVMWTDSFQIVMMFAGLISVLVQGSINQGGFQNIWQDNVDGGRVDFSDFDLNPFRRHTFWTLTVGGGFTWLAIYGVNQAQIQRALCVPTLRYGQIAMWMNVIGLTGLLSVCCLAGMVIYSEYKDCDPMCEGSVLSSDQLLPYYVMDKLSHAPGLPGLFTASLFSGALSTISSGLNSLAAVSLQDIIKTTKWKDISEERATLVTKILAVVYGVVCMVLTFVAAELGSVLQAALALFGMIGGPLLGIFVLGVMFPCANWIGAMVGLFSGLVITFWVGVGAQVHKVGQAKLNMTVAGCPSLYTNLTMTTTMETIKVCSPGGTPDGVLTWYELSYLHYGTLAVLWVVVVGILVSWATGPTMPGEVDPILLNPLTDAFCCCWPKKALSWCRCFIPLYEEKDENKEIDNSVDGEKEGQFQNGLTAHDNRAFEVNNTKL